jgi:hypothetical protein
VKVATPINRFAISLCLIRLRLNGILLYEVSMERRHDLRVPVLPEEREAIRLNAKNAGLSVAAYLRNVGQGYKTNSVVDFKSIEDLAKINADLARLGNLLKLVMTNDNKVKYFGQNHILKMLDNLALMQNEMKATMAAILNKRSF